MKIFNIKDKLEYLEEVACLTQREWGNYKDEAEFTEKVNRKIEKIKNDLEKNDFCCLILLADDELVGFISLFPTDCDERSDLSPWYATMYVKSEYRGRGSSRILNDAILNEAKMRGFDKIYLKSDLVNYYQKFGAKYMEELSNGESLYYFDLGEISYED